jgi:preprotein translocase subunit YajC
MISFLSTAWAQTATSGVASSGSSAGPLASAMQFLPMVAIFFIFYLLLIRPQQKQQKLHKKMVSDAKRGDDVLMNSGLHGKIAEVKDDHIMLQVANNMVLKFDRANIQQIKDYKKSA